MTPPPPPQTTSQPATRHPSLTFRQPRQNHMNTAVDGTARNMHPSLELNGSSAAAETNGETSASASVSATLFKPVQNGRSDNDTSSNDGDLRRPTSVTGAPNRRNGSRPSDTKDDLGSERPRRPVKPMLVRSKSEFGRPPVEQPEPADEEIPEWGARHGFEDHYQSDHIISQLANVSCTPTSITACRPH